MRILIIDDDQELTCYLKLALEDFHHQVYIINDGVIGEKMAIDNEYDIIILDVMLPGQHGFLISKTIRKNSIKTPILMVTSCDSQKEEEAGFIAGANDYLVKPFEFPELYKKLVSLHLHAKLRE